MKKSGFQRLNDTMPQVKQLIEKQAATQTQPYPPSGGFSGIEASATLFSVLGRLEGCCDILVTILM